MTSYLKLKTRVYLSFLFLSCAPFLYSSYAQDKGPTPVTKEEVNNLVYKIADSLETYYVNLEMGRKIGNHLKTNLDRGDYNHILKPKSLAIKLTAELRSINGDKHLGVLYRPVHTQASTNKTVVRIDKSGIYSNYGFQEVKILNGNIGYVKITNFSNWNYIEEAKKAATATMNMVSNTDAIIFDVRNNRGGVPNLVAHLSSYLFKGERVKLTQYVHRFNNGGYGLFTDPTISGRKRPNVPVYILVNRATASAGEEFAFWLKNLKRATIIGERTMGAGYGAMSHRLNDRFVVSISSEEEINPYTNTGFEQVGVTPSIKTEKTETLDKAVELAKIAAKEFRLKLDLKHAQMLDSLKNTLADTNSTFETIYQQLLNSIEAGILEERKINAMGYEYKRTLEKLKTAEFIFKANTILYPESANCYDSYAEILASTKQFSSALKNYKKAVELAEKNNDPNLEAFRINVKKLEDELKSRSDK